MANLGKETVVVVRAALVTSARDGSQGRDWENATRTPVEGCMVQPFLMSNKLIQEDNQSREFTNEFRRVWLPANADVLYTDRLEWRGKSGEAFGDAQEWVRFSGDLHHIQVIMRIRRG